jgi:Fe-S-cluster formation regulator IscX/YfhJ
MSDPQPNVSDDDAAELELLRAAVAKADADPRYVTHDDMRAWLLRLAAGEFDAPLPPLQEP